MSENQQKTMVQEVPLTDDMFERIGTEGLSGEDIGKQSLTYWADVWRRFRSNKMAILGLILLIAVICLLFIGPTLSGKDYQFIDASIKNTPPNSEYWFGTDDMGRDLFTRVCVGGRVSIYIGLCCTLNRGYSGKGKTNKQKSSIHAGLWRDGSPKAEHK